MNSHEDILSLGELIAKLRKEKGLSQRKFAQVSGLSNTTVSRIENGETHNPGIETIKLLAAHLDYDEAKLIELIDPYEVYSKPQKKAVLKSLKKPVKRIKRYSSVFTSNQIQEEVSLTAQVDNKNTDLELAKKVALKGMRLITLRLERNITQKELADALGIDKTLISQYEGEIIKPDLLTIQKLANFFEVDVEYFIGSQNTAVSATKSIDAIYEEEIIVQQDEFQGLKVEYLNAAKELQDAGIEIEDVKAFINIIRKYKIKG